MKFGDGGFGPIAAVIREAQATRNLGLKDFSLPLEMTVWGDLRRLYKLLSPKETSAAVYIFYKISGCWGLSFFSPYLDIRRER